MDNLQSLSSAVLDSAKTKVTQKNALHFLTFTFVALSVVITGHWLYILAVAAFISEFFSWVVSWSADNKKSLGQELLRLNILQQAFGSRMSVDIAYLKSKITESEYLQAGQYKQDNYYATAQQNPEKRLVEILRESCFWSQHLYQKCSSSAVLTSAGLLLAIVILTVTGLTLVETDINYSIPRLSLLFLMFFPLWSSIDNAIKYSSAARKLAGIDQRIGNIGYEPAGILSIFSEYNIVTSGTPLIPQKVYDREQMKLNSLWNERVRAEEL